MGAACVRYLSVLPYADVLRPRRLAVFAALQQQQQIACRTWPDMSRYAGAGRGPLSNANFVMMPMRAAHRWGGWTARRLGGWACRRTLQGVRGHSAELDSPHLASRNPTAVATHPNPYFTLLAKSIDDASSKYLVGQLTSATV